MNIESPELETETPPTKANAPKPEVILWLEMRVQNLMANIQQEEFWQVLMNPATPSTCVEAMMRELYLEIVGYQPHVIEAAIASIGQMPRSMDVRMVRAMLFHQVDEFDHGEMALRDYVGLGGIEAEARNRRMSPEAFAVAGMWWMIVRLRDPYAYLGALYLFEGLTPTVTGLIKSRLRETGLSDSQLEYVEFHSTEDIKHANLVNHMIAQTIQKFPDALDSVKHGYECFEAVYPLPLWRRAFQRARQQHGLTRP